MIEAQSVEYKQTENKGRKSRTIAFGDGHVRFSKTERDLLDECVEKIKQKGTLKVGFPKTWRITRRSVGHFALMKLRERL